MRKIVILIIFANFLSCKGEDCTRQIALFFNPSHSANIPIYHVKAITKDKVIIDTVIKNSYIDQSILVKCFSVNQTEQITLIINDKKRIIQADSLRKLDGPLNLFTSFDDRIILDSLFKSYTAESIKKNGSIPEYKAFVDSLMIHSSTLKRFDSLMIYIKRDKCWCRKK